MRKQKCIRSSFSEKNEKTKYVSATDIVFSGIIAGAGLFVFFVLSLLPGGSAAVIAKNGEVIAELPLYIDTEMTVTGEYENIITVENGEVFVRSSTCRNQICVDSGSVSLSGQTIVCAPNSVVITIRGEGELDAVSQ